MENYKKGKNIEEPLERENISIENLPKKFLWMHVRGGSKIRNLLKYALKEFLETDCVVWTGFGPAVGKTITCAEIMKREFGHNVHQLTKICYRKVDEYWDPVIPELDQLVVKRRLPMIHIVLSRERFNDDELGYQAPGNTLTYTSKTNTPKTNTSSMDDTNSAKGSRIKKGKQNKSKSAKSPKVS